MNARTRLVCTAVLPMAAAALFGWRGPVHSARLLARGQQVPSFRSGVTAVPIDVRVVGKDGQPITDLQKDDFTILEDGVPQTIAHFAVQMLVADAPGPALRARPDAHLFDPSPQNQRVFLIVLGTRALGDRKRHPETLDALIHFVRDRLLPQDQVAVLAPPRMPGDYNRVVGFTSDHAKVVQFLETFRGAPTPVPPGAGETSGEVRAGRTEFAPAEVLDKSPAVKADLGFEEYVRAWGTQTIGLDVDFLLYALKYLRYMNGQKHLVFVAERGLEVPVFRDGAWHMEVLWEHVKYLTSVASDARVALDTIQIGERVGDMNLPPLADPPPPSEPAVRSAGSTAEKMAARAQADGGSRMEGGTGAASGALSSPSGNAVFDNPLSLAARAPYDLRYIAGQTGGLASIFKDAAPALARIDTSTRASYLLAYYPANGDWNGRYRSLKVLVNRPGATVFFRHGYYASREADVFDRRRVVANSRIESAGYQLADLPGIDLKFVPAFTKGPTGRGGEVLVPLSIDVSRLSWTLDADGRHVARLEVAIFCGDGGNRILGQTRRLLNLALTDESYERAMTDRFSREMRVPVSSAPRYVKVIVYDYDADRVGSALVKVGK